MSMNIPRGFRLYFLITFVIIIESDQSSYCPEYFSCGNKWYIPHRWYCDGDDDCGDLVDEAHCDIFCHSKPSYSPGSEWISLNNTAKNDGYLAKRQLKCSEGYEKVGDPEIVECQVDGSWTRTSAFCREILCDPIFEPSASPGTEWVALDEKNNSYGAKRLLKCSKGYRKVGYPEIVQCQLDGFWTNTSAFCREILCDSTFEPSASPGTEWVSLEDDVAKSNSYGAKRQLKCSKGYVKVGCPEIVKCQLDGSWTETSATCRDDKFIDAGNVLRKNKTSIAMIIVIVILVLIILVLIGTNVYFARIAQKFRYQRGDKEIDCSLQKLDH